MKKLIFDVDGTILDSMHIWIEPQNELFSKYGFRLEDLTKEEKGKIEALSFEAMCVYIADEIAKNMTAQEVMDHFDYIITDGYKNTLMPKNGAIEILKKLKDAGFSMAVASSTSYPYLKMALTRLGIFDYFDFFATPDLLDMKKSDPDYWHYIIKKYGAKASDCILFDDALYAIKAAGKEGIRTVGLKDFPWNENEWIDIKKEANQVMDTIAEIDIENLK